MSNTPATTIPVASRKPSFPPLLTWQNPARTGTVFAEILGALVILKYGNLLRFGLRLTYWGVALTGIAEYASRTVTGKNKGIVSSYKLSRYIDVNQATLEKYTNRFAKITVEGLHDVKRLFDAEDLSLSLSVFIGAFVGYLLTGVLSISSLLIFAVLLTFGVPPFYLKFHKEIDHYTAIAHKEASKHINTASVEVNKKIGPQLDVAKKHLGTVTSLIGLSNRGGFPSDASKSAKTTSADVPPVGIAKPSEPVVKTPKVTEVPSKPVAPQSASASTAAYPDIAKFDTVPSLIGNVNVNPNLPAHASDDLKAKVADLHVKATDAATDATADLNDDPSKLASDFKQSLADDKKFPSF